MRSVSGSLLSYLSIDELITFTSETQDESSPDAVTDPTAVIDADDDDDEVITGPRVQARVKLAATICACNFSFKFIGSSS